jgi:hypothetical protein
MGLGPMAAAWRAVHTDMYSRAFAHVPVDLLEKISKLGRPVPFAAFPDPCPGGDAARNKERCRAVADAGMRAPRGHAGGHRPERRLTVKRLYPGFLVCTQDDSPVRRRQTHSGETRLLIHEQRIG